MFEFLFNYPLEWFSRGSLILPLPWWQLLIAFTGTLALTYVALGYFHLRNRLPLQDRLVLTLLRGVALSLLILSLSRPLLEVASPVAQPNVVAILLDNSASMSLSDQSGQTRSQFIRQQFAAADGDLLRSLAQRFDTRLFSFGVNARPLDDILALDFNEGDSNLVDALEHAREAMQGEPLAGLVLVSDGAGKRDAGLEQTLLSLRANGIPVHTIGVGEAQYARDIELGRIRLPSAVLPGSRIVAEVDIRQRGYDGEQVDLVVEADSRILHQQPVRLEAGMQSLRIPLKLDDSGAQSLKFELTALPDEQTSANNSHYATISVEERLPRILYFEGEPRFELKFARRALADDENLLLIGLIRTADAKYYRVGVESKEELRNGFPSTRDELFAYDALILGSVEISLLSREQQEMIVEFVSERGGGLLLLGGRHAFSEGGYQESVLNTILPVVLDPVAQLKFARRISIEPTTAALEHAALLLADSADESLARWRTLPPLTTVNPLRRIKPGASLLLSGRVANETEPYVVMAAQRYGRGKVVAFAVQNSWLWQMHHDIDLEDQSHELLWRQLLRWLVEDVPPELTLEQSTQSIFSGGSIRVRSELLNPDSAAANEAAVRAIVTLPDGREQSRPMRPDPSRRGYYEAEINAAEAGSYRLRVEMEESGRVVSSREAGLRVSPQGDEFFASEMNEALLRQIARDSGGRFFTAADSGGLVDAFDRLPGRAKVLQRLDLWDMPVLFLLLVTLLCGEWVYRRWRRVV